MKCVKREGVRVEFQNRIKFIIRRVGRGTRNKEGDREEYLRRLEESQGRAFIQEVRKKGMLIRDTGFIGLNLVYVGFNLVEFAFIG